MTTRENNEPLDPPPPVTPSHAVAQVIAEAAELLGCVRVLDCGAHYCRYCPAKSPNWEHSPHCPYTESQEQNSRAREVRKQLLALVSSSSSSIPEAAATVREMELRAVKAEAALYSISVMLGWSNTPPLRTLEMDIAALKARAALPEASGVPVGGGWQPIDIEPKHDGPHSLRLLVWSPRYSYAFGHFTPFYKRHRDEAHSLWTMEGFSWAHKPTHWRPLPAPPGDQQAPPSPVKDE